MSKLETLYTVRDSGQLGAAVILKPEVVTQNNNCCTDLSTCTLLLVSCPGCMIQCCSVL